VPIALSRGQRTTLVTPAQNIYPETMAIDNPDLAGRLVPGLGRPLPCGPRLFAALCLLAAFSLFAAALATSKAETSDKLRIALQKTGTFAWELAVVREEEPAGHARLETEITEVASPEAAKIALMGGSADLILSDWLWVARQRSLGVKLVFFPYSTALGALMVPQASNIQELSDLKGKKIAVAGGPLDKSWLLLQSLAKRSGLELAREADILYGAPALLYQKALSGEADASLNYWNFCAALEARGYRRLLSMDDAERRLGAEGPVAMVGYVFREEFAKTHAPALARFFAAAAKAKKILAHSGEAWEKIGQLLGIADKAELALYRQTYIEGIPRRPIAKEAADARELYRILATTGGPELVGDAAELDKGTFYQPPDAARDER
jgi:NitT/TauT family transport system substrate-binding protein